MGIVIYGASDDLIEVEGDVREEFDHLDQEGRYVGTSNGAVVHVTSVDGDWRCRAVAGHELVRIVPARGDGAGNDEDGCPGYSDKAVVDGEVAWVVVGREWAQ